MNKLIFLSGLLTALLFIGTAHGGQYEETSELEQQILQAMMQDSDDLMETVDEEDNEMADEEDNEMANAEQAAIVVTLIKKMGCVAAKRYCGLQDIMMAKQQGWRIRSAFRKVKDAARKVIRKVGDFFRKVGDAVKRVATKGNFCKAVKLIC